MTFSIKPTSIVSFLSALFLLSTGMNFAQGAAASDQDFLTRAIRNNQLELRLGHLATERGNSPDMKAMGEKMVKNHGELEQQLEALAQKSGASTPELTAEQQATFSRLASLSGPAFDQNFKQTLNDIHVHELSMYQNEINLAQDPQLHALAQKRVATLQKTVNQAGQAGATHP